MKNHGARRKAVPTTIAGALALLIGVAVTWWKSSGQPAPTTPVPAAKAPGLHRPPKITSNVGWTSKASLESHYRKHSAEFPDYSMDDYLRSAQALRDASKSESVLETVRSDGVITRFNRDTGDFIAFNPDKTIRTFFRPADGESYFKRQGDRSDD